jgi:hypothetical protein
LPSRNPHIRNSCSLATVRRRMGANRWCERP